MRATSFSILFFQSAAPLAANATGRCPECCVREMEIHPPGFRCAEFRFSPERSRDRSPPAGVSRNEPERVLPRTTFPPSRVDRPAFACPPERLRRETKPALVFATGESAAAAAPQCGQNKCVIILRCFQLARAQLHGLPSVKFSKANRQSG